VAIGTEDLRPHRTALRGAIQVPHVGEQARLGQRTAAGMKYRVA
jgi:hypothetical protein